MKTLKNRGANLILMLMALIITAIYSCKKEESGGAPTIERVRTLTKTDTIKVTRPIDLDNSKIVDKRILVPFDSTIVNGQLQNTYLIVGTNLSTAKSLTINGTNVYFNSTLVTNNSLIFSVPKENIDYGPNQSKMLVLTTAFGMVTYQFPILQPAPTILSFAPLAAGAGDIVTIKGTIFENLDSVRFNEVRAEIVGTPTTTEIKVKVPMGIVQAKIFVSTKGGTTQSVGSFGFKRVVYDDAYAASWSSTGYNSATTEVTTNVKRGTKSLKCNYIGGYGAYRAGYNGSKIDVVALGLTAIKISIYGGPGSEGKKVNISFNDTYTNGKRVSLILKEGVYTDFTVPLSSLGSPTEIKEIILQEFSGFAPSTIYIDDIGFI